MKHKHSNRILSRAAHHRIGLLKSLASSLLEHGTIITTEAKAKELRKHIEPLITSAKLELTLARRRSLIPKLLHKQDLPKLVAVAKTHATRPGGYVRMTRLPAGRADNAPMMRVDIIEKQRS